MNIPDQSTILHANQSLDEPRRRNNDNAKLLKNFEKYTDQAKTVIKSLKNTGLAELKSMGSPPSDCIYILECIMIILRKPASDQKQWVKIKQILTNNHKLYDQLRMYDYSNIMRETVEKIQKKIKSH